MSFRLVVRLPGDRRGPGYSDCTRASDAYAILRRLSRTRLRVEQILDLRSGRTQEISAPELGAIAQCERRDRGRTSASNGGA